MLISNFASGELSENLNGRVDLPQYYQGASRLSNFDVIPTGGIKRRVGLERMGQLNGNCRLVPFIVDKNLSFILEFCADAKIYIWQNGERKMTVGNEPMYLDTASQELQDAGYNSLTDIEEMHYAQNFNEMIFVHKKHNPISIKYNISGDNFTLERMSFDFFPDVQLDDDFNYVVIAGDTLPVKVPRTDGQLAFIDREGNTIVTGDKAYCVKDGKLYKWNKDSQVPQWEPSGIDPTTDASIFTTSGKYPGAVTFFNNRLWFAGTENDRQKVWASAAPDTEGTRYRDFTTYQKYVTVSKIVKDPDLHVFTGTILLQNIDSVNGETTITDVSQDFTGTDALKQSVTAYYCSNNDYIPLGVKVKSITSRTIVLDTDLSSIIDKDIYRIVFSIQLWKNPENASADDYEYSVTSNNITTSDCSFNFEIASDHNDAIKFIAANKYLSIGTESSLWNVPGSVNALNVQAEMAGRYGSDNIQGQAIGTAMCFFAQGKYGIRETYYNNEQEAFITNNIAIMAEQMLKESPAVDFDYMVNPYNRIVIVRDDGKVVTMLYDKTNGIQAWNRIEHGANKKFESCAIVRGDRQCDIVYFSVKDGNNYYLERLDENAEVFLDSFSEYDPEHTSGYTSDAVVYDVTKDEVIPLSEIENLNAGENDEIYIGYLYESEIVSMPVIANDPTGKKRITNLLVRFLNSYMPEMTCENTTEYFTDVETPYSGIKSIDFAGNSERDVKFNLNTEKPYPCNILSINAKLA